MLPGSGVVGSGVGPGKAKSPSSSAGAGGSQFLKRQYVTAVKKPSNARVEIIPKSGDAALRHLARDGLPLREPVEKKHASDHDADEPEGEERVEERFGRRARLVRAARSGARRRDRDDGDEPQHDECR